MSPPDDQGSRDLPSRASEYTPEERATLIRTAHRAIAAALSEQQFVALPDARELSSRLSEPRGAFTTLHIEGRLRGCVGYVAAVKPLLQTVAETAVSAAFHDPRFPPVKRGSRHDKPA